MCKYEKIKQHAIKQPIDQKNFFTKSIWKISRDKWKEKYKIPKVMGFSKGSIKKVTVANIYIDRKISNQQPKFTPKWTIKKKNNLHSKWAEKRK